MQAHPPCQPEKETLFINAGQVEHDVNIRLFDMVGCLSNAMDLVSPEVVGHHCRVGIIAARLAGGAGLSGQTQADLAMAGMLHDVGAFSLKDRLAALAFDSDDQSHAEIGYRLLAGYPGFERVAAMVRGHHAPWSRPGGPSAADAQEAGSGPPEESPAWTANLLCLADRVDSLLPRGAAAPFDKDAVLARIRAGSGRLFNPRWVEVLGDMTASRDLLGQAARTGGHGSCLLIPDLYNPVLAGKDISILARLFSQIIDFRCRFTATHSRGVSAVAMALASEMKLNGGDRSDLEIAGELHDLGKLCIPAEIILKPGPLDSREMTIMQSHASHGFHALFGVPGLAGVAEIAGQHHERLDGNGYPGGLAASAIGMASRALAVSDVFTALAEDRPYRAGMELERIVSILEDMAARKTLDAGVVGIVSSRRHVIDGVRRQAQAEARAEFEHFSSGLYPGDAMAPGRSAG
jgi:HD-GYP domain-containing protein (c-di-GMP phosphodiesterase class II)